MISSSFSSIVLVVMVISMGIFSMTIESDDVPDFSAEGNNEWSNIFPIKSQTVSGNTHSSDRNSNNNNNNNSNSNSNIVNMGSLNHRFKASLYFTKEPVNQIIFYNTEGTIVECRAQSTTGKTTSAATTHWVDGLSGRKSSDVPGLRYTRDDGLLVFPPFTPNNFNSTIHSSSYVCIASNKHGSISSRTVTLRGVIRRSSTIHVHDQHVISGGSAAFTCHISDSVSGFMRVSSWLEEPSGRIIPSLSSKQMTLGTLMSSKYISFEESNQLIITSISRNLNNNRYRCRVICKLTGEMFTSSSSGRLIVQAHREPFSPRILVKSDLMIGDLGGQTILTCIASGYPLASYKWLLPKQINSSKVSNDTGYSADNLKHGEGFEGGNDNPGNDGRFTHVNQFLIIKPLRQTDEGSYGCSVNNSVGSDAVSIQLMVRSPLSVNLSVSEEWKNNYHITLISCDYSGSPATSVLWKHNGRSLELGQGHFKLLTPAKLRIEKITHKEEGYYQCFVQNEHESVHATVELRKPRIALKFLETFESSVYSEGDSFQLICKIQGNPKPRLTWTLDFQPIPLSNSKRELITQIDTKDNSMVSWLKIYGISLLDGGLYACSAENMGRKIVHARRIEVRGLPFVKSILNRTTITGSRLTIHCPIVGYPIDRLLWTKDGQKLPYTENQQVNSEGMLEIFNVTKFSDQGRYTCQAFQGNYSAEASFWLSVQVKPLIENFGFPGGLREGQRASVSCTIATGDYPITIGWYKDGESIPVSSISPKVIKVSDYSSSLIFEFLDVIHRGNYTCQAMNDAGYTNHSAYLEIHESPIWTLEPSDSWSVKGDKIIIHCQATGYPVPRIRWSRSFDLSGKEFKPIVSNPHIQVYENGSLIIHETIQLDAGYYLCQAHNSVGPGLSKVIHLNVYVKAHFTVHFTQNYANLDENITLNCVGHGEDPLDIQWLKDTRLLSWIYVVTKGSEHYSYGLGELSRYQLIETHSNGTIQSQITISSIKRDDNGLFVCRVTNSFGSDEKKLKLIVQEPPGQPSGLVTNEISSRWIVLSWVTLYNGQSPITNHLIEYTELPVKSTNDSVKIMVLMGSIVTGKISGLKPGQNYLITVIAENRVGRSRPSQAIKVSTEEEPPTGPPLYVNLIPLSSTSIKVTWEPPEQAHRNGLIKGYYIGYKLANEVNELYNYQTINQTDQSYLPGSINSAVLDGLRQLAKYSIVVHAFNGKGSSPPSNEKEVTTFGIDLPFRPKLTVVYVSATSIHLAWTQAIDETHPIQGFIIYHQLGQVIDKTGKWSQIKLIGHQTFYTFQGLECGTKYSFYSVAYNSMGQSEASSVVSAITNGSLPIAPDYSEAIVKNISSGSKDTVFINLNAWKSAGCPILEFTLRYSIGPSSAARWFTVNISTTSNVTDKHGLVPIDWPDNIDKVQINVRNKLGFTKVEYIFSSSASSPSSSSSLSTSSSSSSSSSFHRASNLDSRFNHPYHQSIGHLSKSSINPVKSTNDVGLTQLTYYAVWITVTWFIVIAVYFAFKNRPTGLWTNRNNYSVNQSPATEVSKIVNTNQINRNGSSSIVNSNVVDGNSNETSSTTHDTSTLFKMASSGEVKCQTMTLVKGLNETTSSMISEPLYSTINKRSDARCKM